MLPLDDPRWPTLKGGYKRPVDLRPLLAGLEDGNDADAAWRDLWNEIHHQGDVGEASFVAIPHLVRIHKARGVIDANTYAMVTTIELARGRDRNPDVPDWAKEGYSSALAELQGSSSQSDSKDDGAGSSPGNHRVPGVVTRLPRVRPPDIQLFRRGAHRVREAGDGVSGSFVNGCATSPDSKLALGTRTCPRDQALKAPGRSHGCKPVVRRNEPPSTRPARGAAPRRAASRVAGRKLRPLQGLSQV